MTATPPVRKRIDFDRDAPRDGRVVTLVMVVNGLLEDMADVRFVDDAWKFEAPAEAQWTMADFKWNGWFYSDVVERA